MSPTLNPQPPIPPAGVKTHGKFRRWSVRLGWCVLVFGALIAAAYVFRAPLLVGLARAWVVNDPVDHADAIVILGGGVENRPFEAARLFHAGVAPRILYMDVKLSPLQERGVYPSESSLTRQVLSSNDIPVSAMQMIGTNVASTFDEACAVRDWAAQNGARSVVITTDLFHTRRARWVFRRELRDTPVKVYVAAVEPIRFKPDSWWQSEEGLIQFQNEMIKSVYYRLKY